ncbi:hypothetical protein IED13_04620 [Bosea sp. SSUT16]|uniref:Uncharacterized protein n=1 Tax=Bosea spartocytisi TaxID=2773451 RepID=A0A927E7Y2_9HYPH|nr:hypothetical protein [Bosea spartocytisi]MBD3844970.1 hypothetical protein [Bosea spartocytisi]MCT4471171.1 hypothetical protein [Bosea spartocytisi]
MSSTLYPPSPAAMASRLGHHLLLSLGVVTTVALLAALPALLSGTAPGQGARAAIGNQASVPALAMLRNGKIADRLERISAGGAEILANAPVTPAALAMPMSLNWPEIGEWAPPQLAMLSERRPRAGDSTPRAVSRRSASPTTRAVAASGPLVILPPAAATAIEIASTAETSHDDSWSRLVIAPATKVVDAVSGAAGGVQAVGSWGLSQASGLLPRW